MEGLNTMYKVMMRLVVVMMMVMMIVVMILVMMMMTIRLVIAMMIMLMILMTQVFNSLAPQVAYDDGEVISERIIYRYLEGDLYIET